MRSFLVGLMLCVAMLVARVPLVEGADASSQPAKPAPLTLVKRFNHWGYGYRHYRHRANAFFRGPNVDQSFYDFLVRLPFLKSSVDASTKPPMVILLHSRGGDFDRRERRWPDHVVLLPDDNTAGVGHSGWFGYHELAPKPPHRDTVVVPYTERRLVYLIRFALKEFHVDPNRIWISGGSMGGGGALLFALRHPEWVAGVVATKPPIDMRVLPTLLPLAVKAFGPRTWELKVAGTNTSVWQLTSAAWLLSQQPACRTWIEIQHGRMDKVVPFQQYYTSVSPPGQSFLQLFERGLAPGIFVWDMSSHQRPDPIGSWRAEFNPLALGLVRRDLPTFAFSNPSIGHLGVPQQPGTWKAKRRPERHTRGTVNGFCRWGSQDLLDRPDRLEVSLWLTDEGTDWQRCPIESATYSVSPRGPYRFPIPPKCAFSYSVEPDGPSGRATSDEHGVLTIERVPFHRGRSKAVRLRIQHAMTLPVLAIESPTHSTSLPGAPTTVLARWRVANGSTDNPMPVDRYRCWIAPVPGPPPNNDCETPEAERVFESLKPGRYYVMVQARLVTGRWGPISTREVNVVHPF